MKRSISGHLYNTGTAKPIERVVGKHERLTLYITKVKRLFLHIEADTHSIYAGYDKEQDKVIPREDLLPVSQEEAQRIMNTFKEKEVQHHED